MRGDVETVAAECKHREQLIDQLVYVHGFMIGDGHVGWLRDAVQSPASPALLTSFPLSCRLTPKQYCENTFRPFAY
jgi:hypothetical protein